MGEEGARTDTAKCADKLSHRGCERSRHSHCSVSAASVYAALLPVRHPTAYVIVSYREGGLYSVCISQGRSL